MITNWHKTSVQTSNKNACGLFAFECQDWRSWQSWCRFNFEIIFKVEFAQAKISAEISP
jgi:hypothetical protein